MDVQTTGTIIDPEGLEFRSFNLHFYYISILFSDKY